MRGAWWYLVFILYRTGFEKRVEAYEFVIRLQGVYILNLSIRILRSYVITSAPANECLEFRNVGEEPTSKINWFNLNFWDQIKFIAFILELFHCA